MLAEVIPEWALTAPDEGQIASLLARCFATDFDGRSFFQQRHQLRIVARHKSRIIGHMGLMLRAVRVDRVLTDVVGLADVATDPDHRGKGIAATLLQAAIAEAKRSPATHFLLFGTAGLYAGAGFRKATNTITYLDLTGARTRDVHREPARELMVLPLRDQPWDDSAALDLLGTLF
jgi:predicted N-acetyltransferase YhbS